MPANRDKETILRPLKGKPGRRRRIIAVDIETDGLGGPMLLGAYTREGEETITYFDDMNMLLTAMLDKRNRGFVWYAHNGGAYDYSYLIPAFVEYIRERGYTVKPMVRREIAIIGYIIKHGDQQIELRDSYTLLNTTLDKITASFAPEYHKRDIGLSRGVRFNPLNPAHREYLAFDVLGLKHALIALDQLLIEYFNVHMNWSASSTAVDAFRRTLDRPHRRVRPSVDQFVRAGYFGGLTGMHGPRKLHDAITVDVHAMYAHAMRQGVPWGMGTRTTTYKESRPGFYRARAYCPPSVPVPFVGQMLEHEGDQLRWGRGYFDTVISSLELPAAHAAGYTFDIQEGIVFNGIIHPFNSIVDQCEALETANRHTPIAETVKMLRNSLYGKFGARHNRKDYIIAPELPPGYSPTINPNSHDLQAIPYLFWRDEYIDRPYMFPHWAAWITANARLYLLDMCQQIGWANVAYVDTDSITAPSYAIGEAIADGRISIGPAYGQLKIEEQWRDRVNIAPKLYYGTNIEGQRVTKAAGVPRQLATYERMEAVDAGEAVTVEWQGIAGPLAQLKGAARQQTRTRTIKKEH